MRKEKNVVSKETQVEIGNELKCSECEFQATSDSEFSWHMGKNHGWSHDQSQTWILVKVYDIVKDVTMKLKIDIH